MHQPLQMESLLDFSISWGTCALLIAPSCWLSSYQAWTVEISGSYENVLHFNRTLGLSCILTTVDSRGLERSGFINASAPRLLPFPMDLGSFVTCSQFLNDMSRFNSANKC